MTQHAVSTREEWLAARRELLEREKELTRRSDELARQRQDLPWVRVDEEYVFETDDGPKTLAELFDGRSQLIVYHFMHGPNTPEGCPGCTLNTTWQLLDRAPRGRSGEPKDWPLPPTSTPKRLRGRPREPARARFRCPTRPSAAVYRSAVRVAPDQKRNVGHRGRRRCQRSPTFHQGCRRGRT